MLGSSESSAQNTGFVCGDMPRTVHFSWLFFKLVFRCVLFLLFDVSS